MLDGASDYFRCDSLWLFVKSDSLIALYISELLWAYLSSLKAAVLFSLYESFAICLLTASDASMLLSLAFGEFAAAEASIPRESNIEGFDRLASIALLRPASTDIF